MASEWRPIDNAPTHRRVLVWDGERHVDLAHYETGKRDWMTGPRHGLGFQPRYWSPVPALVRPDGEDK